MSLLLISNIKFHFPLHFKSSMWETTLQNNLYIGDLWRSTTNWCILYSLNIFSLFNHSKSYLFRKFTLVFLCNKAIITESLTCYPDTCMCICCRLRWWLACIKPWVLQSSTVGAGVNYTFTVTDHFLRGLLFQRCMIFPGEFEQTSICHRKDANNRLIIIFYPSLAWWRDKLN